MIYQPKDSEQQIIDNAISSIPQVATFVTSASGEWVSVVLSRDTLNIILQPRTQVTWFFSTTSGGNHFTMWNGAALQSRLVSVSGTIIGWAASNQGIIFELLQGC
jgi:hypothetical protein